jgi:predicted enzyme related to lactoylglutathione lyase
MAYFVDEGGNQVGHLFQLEYLKLPTGQTIEFAASQSGPILYLEMANDLNDTLELVEKNGGHVLMPKSLVAPGKGYWALFLDTEGNRLALHSAH